MAYHDRLSSQGRIVKFLHRYEKSVHVKVYDFPILHVAWFISQEKPFAVLPSGFWK